MFRSLSIGVVVFLMGVLVGVGASQSNRPEDEQLPAYSPNLDNSKRLPTPESLRRNDKLLRRVLSLEKRVVKLERERLNFAQPREPLKTKTEDVSTEAVDEGQLVTLVGEAIRDESSSLRADVSQVVKDEFDNMRSEWRAFRKARHEIRDEEFLISLMKVVDLGDSERAQLDGLLADERLKIVEIRAKARETFDIRSARERRQELRDDTDERALEVLGSDDYEAWKELRQQRRGPGRR